MDGHLHTEDGQFLGWEWHSDFIKIRGELKCVKNFSTSHEMTINTYKSPLKKRGFLVYVFCVRCGVRYNVPIKQPNENVQSFSYYSLKLSYNFYFDKEKNTETL